MPVLTIADRRAIMITSMLQADCRDELRNHPDRAVKRITGRSAPEGASITVFEEQPDAWEFVIPANAIEADLPAPQDARSVIENDVYELLRDEPAVRARVVAGPKAFLSDRFQFDIGDTGINVREERPGELLLILPYADSREELDDVALDMVAGGGDPNCQSAEWKATRSTAGHEA